ncbi:MAG: hypothetical protein COA57_09455 [Flavobacteriales bacterium]|nr:MAG: hypothetical protein COA57_09455 [Flavobacteriales bacterium]
MRQKSTETTVSPYFCRATAGDTACDKGISVDAGAEEATVLAEELGSGAWINVTNNDTETAGAYEVAIKPA